MKLRLGTRNSPLAMVQSRQVARLLEEANSDGGLSVELVPMLSSGDKARDRPLREVGGKGLFVKELDEGLLAGRIDLAVHSLKDVPTLLPAGIALASVPRRADARDVLISKEAWTPASIPATAVVGTSSLRRSSQLLALFAEGNSPRITLLRGNVETRLRRLAEGVVDATFLARAGLSRLAIDTSPALALDLDPFEFVPAPGQGALAIMVRSDDVETASLAAAIQDAHSRVAVDAERTLAHALGGDCNLPVGVYAEAGKDSIEMVAVVVSADGRRSVKRKVRGPGDQALGLAASMATEMLEAGAAEIVAEAASR
ncbi:MAG: hydroxymethylbilane synthase [Deltaproteobacteria bacterium]